MKTTILEQRNEAIKKSYERLTSLKKYRLDYICEMVGKEFWVTPAVVMAVVFEKGKYKPNPKKNEENEENKPA
jgi:hypothetical protein